MTRLRLNPLLVAAAADLRGLRGRRLRRAEARERRRAAERAASAGRRRRSAQHRGAARRPAADRRRPARAGRQARELLGQLVRALPGRASDADRARRRRRAGDRRQLQGRARQGARLPRRARRPLRPRSAPTRPGAPALDWGIYGVPETFVVDGDGTILLRHPGPLTREILEEQLRPAIDGRASDRGRRQPALRRRPSSPARQAAVIAAMAARRPRRAADLSPGEHVLADRLRHLRLRAFPGAGADRRRAAWCCLTRSADRLQARFTSMIPDVRVWVDAEDAAPERDLRAILAELGLAGRTHRHRMGGLRADRRQGPAGGGRARRDSRGWRTPRCWSASCARSRARPRSPMSAAPRRWPTRRSTRRSPRPAPAPSRATSWPSCRARSIAAAATIRRTSRSSARAPAR